MNQSRKSLILRYTLAFSHSFSIASKDLTVSSAVVLQSMNRSRPRTFLALAVSTVGQGMGFDDSAPSATFGRRSAISGITLRRWITVSIQVRLGPVSGNRLRPTSEVGGARNARTCARATSRTSTLTGTSSCGTRSIVMVDAFAGMT